VRLQVRSSLPEDGEAYRLHKIGEALDVSHVQMARYLGAADYALRQALATRAERPQTEVQRYYARDQRSYTGPMKFSVFKHRAPERATFPVLGFEGQPDVRAGKAPITAGTNDGRARVGRRGVVASAYEPIEREFNQFKAPCWRYRLRFNAIPSGLGGARAQMVHPNLDTISRGAAMSRW